MSCRQSSRQSPGKHNSPSLPTDADPDRNFGPGIRVPDNCYAAAHAADPSAMAEPPGADVTSQRANRHRRAARAECIRAIVQAAAAPETRDLRPEGAGSIPKILHELLEPAAGRRVEIKDCHDGYAARCRVEQKRALPPVQFVDPVKEFCRRAGIRTKTEGDRFYLVGVQLVASLSERQTNQEGLDR